jgi:hypothetical protein
MIFFVFGLNFSFSMGIVLGITTPMTVPVFAGGLSERIADPR